MPASTASLSNYNQGYLAEDGIEHAAGVPAGLAGARQVVARYFTALPDLYLMYQFVVVNHGQHDDAHVSVTCCDASGRHAGRWRSD